MIGTITTAVPIGDDQQQLQERPEQHLLVMPATGDVARRVTQHSLVEQQRRDRRDERDEVEHAEPARSFLVNAHVARLSSSSSSWMSCVMMAVSPLLITSRRGWATHVE